MIDHIEKILYKSTKQNIEVFLSFSSEQDTTDNSAADELIEKINLYLIKEKEDPQHYLVIKFTSSSLVASAYLANLKYSRKHKFWKLTIIPLVNCDQVDNQDCIYISCQLKNIQTNIFGVKRHYDRNINCARCDQVIEYAKLRIKYFILNHSNFEQYQLELNSIK